MTQKRFCLFVVLLLTPILNAQFDPEGAQVISYFPHLADGGPAAQKWLTSLTFVNPHSSFTTAGTAYFFGNDGKPLALDFGKGAAPSFSFTIPAQGSVTFTTTGASPNTVVGWAIVSSSLPIQGVVLFRFAVNGVAQQGVSAQPTAASQQFRSPATFVTGIAIANTNSNASIPVTVSALDSNGNNVATYSVTLGPLGHASFDVYQLFPSLPPTFRGSVLITTSGSNNFVAWTLSGDLGVLASYPPSNLGWPVSQYERIWKVWQKVLNVAAANFPLGPPPKLVIDFSTSQINSFANPSLNEVHIFMNLAELISDSESELSFVVAHEMGHILQARIGTLIFPTNIELDADQYGMLLSLVAGYDPYGAAGALSKLAMASGQAGLLDQNFDNLTATVGLDLHGSFNNRLELIFLVMQTICAMPQYNGFCTLYKSIIHPHLPAIAPLDLVVQP